MKALVLIVLFFSTSLFAQKDTSKKEFIKEGDLTKYIEYYENGKVAQTGFLKGDKLHGLWIGYDQTGKKLSMGTYDEGKKNSKWIFWSGDKLIEVEYKKNLIVKTVEWDSSQVVAANLN